MTILAMLALLFGIFLACDGAFDRGALVTVLPDTGAPAVIRIAEVAVAGIIFLILGFALSAC